MSTPRPGLSLRGRALRLLSQREHSRTELERKLAAHETVPGELASVLDRLEAQDILSPTRAIESVLHRRASKLGEARLLQELHAKGLTGPAVQAALDKLRASELERAHAVWARKFGEVAPDLQGKARQARFLISRGFTAEVVRRVLDQAS